MVKLFGFDSVVEIDFEVELVEIGSDFVAGFGRIDSGSSPSLIETDSDSVVGEFVEIDFDLVAKIGNSVVKSGLDTCFAIVDQVAG